MVRVVVMVVAVLYLSAATGFAQSLNEISTQPASQSDAKPVVKSPARLDVSAKAAGLDRIGQPQGVRSTVNATTTPNNAPRMSSKKKWLIIGCLAVVGVISIVALSGGYSGDGPGYQ